MYENRPKEAAEIMARFKLVCRKCGSENVVVSVNEGWQGTDVTAGDPGEIAFGCNDCQQNDYSVSL